MDKQEKMEKITKIAEKVVKKWLIKKIGHNYIISTTVFAGAEGEIEDYQTKKKYHWVFAPFTINIDNEKIDMSTYKDEIMAIIKA